MEDRKHLGRNKKSKQIGVEGETGIRKEVNKYQWKKGIPGKNGWK